MQMLTFATGPHESRFRRPYELHVLVVERVAALERVPTMYIHDSFFRKRRAAMPPFRC
jgi:hypothetical protein